MISQHNNTRHLVFLTILLSLFTYTALAQDCTIVGKANDIIPKGKCAPVDVDWKIIYRGVNDGGTGNVQIQYDWDDGNPVEIVNAVNTDLATQEWSATSSHIYPNTGNQCNYQPRATLIVDGVLCTSSVQEQIVTVWDTDDKNGGELLIDPKIKPICVGNDALFHFTDNSQWNCTPPDENDVINNDGRWIQWIYGTGASTINDAEVDGSVKAYPYVGSIDHIPGPIEGPTAPFNTSLDIYIPNHHPVGAFFEVTLRNWNTCNPYDDLTVSGPPTDLDNGDFAPVTTTAMALIVDIPDASINPVPPVCESADPFLLIGADGGGVWSGPGINNPSNPVFDPKAAGPGNHAITYSITDGNNCSDIGSVMITVLAAPKADISTFQTINLCPGILLELDGNPSGGLSPYTHLWKGQTTPLNVTNTQNPDFLSTTIGQYELIYRVEDSNTCWGEDTVIVDVEEVSISFDNNNIELCSGTNTAIDAQPTGGSEVFVFHEWTGTRTEKLSATDVQTPTFNADEAGTFTFTYKVRDSFGCVDSETITITVHEQPNSDAGLDINECGLQSSLNAVPSIGDGFWKLINGPGSLSFNSLTNPTTDINSDTYGNYQLRWVEDNNSCKDSADLSVTFIEIPSPTVMEDKDTCSLSIQIIANQHVGTGQWVVAENIGNVSFDDNSKSTTRVTVDSPGKYKFAWLENNGNGCVGSDTVEINFHQIPIANITPPPSIGCTPLEVEFENNSNFADSYYWDFGNGIISNNENPNQVFTNKTHLPIDYEITMIANTNYGCADTVEHTITVAPAPVAHFDADNKVGCSPLNSTFNNKSQGGTIYQWTFGDGSPGSDFENPTHSFVNNEDFIQSFEVKLVTLNEFSCSDTSSLYTTVYPKQNFNLSASPDSACSPLNTTFLADPGAYEYEWDLGDGNLITGPNHYSKLFENTSNNKEKYNIKLYTTSFYGCLDTTETTITVLPSPQTYFEPNDFTVCSPKTVLFTNSTENIESSIWKFGDGESLTTDGNKDIQHVYTNNSFTPVDFRITLITENSFGCVDSMQGFTSVNPIVTAKITGSGEACSPAGFRFGNESVGANSFLWNYGDGNTSSEYLGSNIFRNNTETDQEFEVSMIATSPYGCSDTTKTTVTVLPSPQTYFEPNNFTVCSPKKVLFTNYTENIESSFWKFGDGETLTTDGNEDVEHIYTSDSFTPTDFKITLITENSFGCEDSMQGFTSVNPIVTAKITGEGEACSPLELSFGNESVGASSFLWDYGDGNTSSGYLGLNLFRNNTEVDQEFEISMIATSPYGCSDTTYTSVTVFATPLANFDINPEELQMPESTVTINNLTSGDNWEYLWDFGDGHNSTKEQPLEHTYNNSGLFEISLKAYSDKCEDIKKKEIRIIAGIPTVEYGPPSQGCPALKVDFYSTTKDAETYIWEFGDGNISSEPNPSHTYYREGTFTVKLTVEGPGGVTVKDDIIIDVYPEPTALFDVFPNVVTIPGEAVSFANRSYGANTYLWDFGDGTTSTEHSPTHEYTSKGNYDIKLDAENEHGCESSYVQKEAVTANEGGQINFPNAFTPNPAGENDGRYDRTDNNNFVFYPAVQKGVEEYELQIYSRWGQLLFESKDIEVGWNGYYQGQLCTQDVYIWKVTCRFSTGQVKVYTGDVTLLR